MFKDHLLHSKKKITYAQNREDLILEAFFPDIKKGTYVDVGGYDPDEDSVTKLFYLKGWSGINIEPQEQGYRRFVSKRKRDINLQYGVGIKPGRLTLRVYRSGGLSTFSDEIKNQYSERDNNDTAEYEDKVVQVKTLKNILDECNIRQKINFMKIDVEGYEYEVIQGNDWAKYRPDVLCIESNHILKDWRPTLEKHNYVKMFFDGINDYYVQKDSDAAKNFDFSEHVLIKKGGGVRYDDYVAMVKMNNTIEEYHTQYLKDVAKVKHLEDENTKLKETLNSPKALVRRLTALTLRDKKHG